MSMSLVPVPAPVSVGAGVEVDGSATDVEVRPHTLRHEGTQVVETWVEVTNRSDHEVVVLRLDSFALDLPPGDYALDSFTSGWGEEFGPVTTPLRTPLSLQSLAGRSSARTHPWCAVREQGGGVLVLGVAWSGNWVLRFRDSTEASPPGGVRITGGLHDTGFAKRLLPGESVIGPRVVLASGADLNAVSVELGRVGREHWCPRNEFADRPPVEWNHWWSYEDHSIDEDVFRANVDVAADLGVDLCTLDAGWFGPSDPSTHWVDYRGDWHLVNARRFPSGLRALSDHVRAEGMRFGLWCEIEALGPKAALNAERPDLVARREGASLGYVCFGSPAARTWAHETLSRLIEEHGADWIKLDFNLDPGLGCDRTDHGHGAGDGLFEHYTGYYAVLDRIRSEHPRVVLENCSSGGLRIDLGMARHTHVTFLSDPDWPEHGLQLLWGASTALHPSRLLHWGWSQWWKCDHPHQTFEPDAPDITDAQHDYYRRIAMVGAYGLSWKLPDLSERLRERLRHHHAIYRETVAPFVAAGDLRRLTGQPRRFGEGDRWAAFQYTRTDSDDHLLLVFRLAGGQEGRTIRPLALEPTGEYAVHRDPSDPGVPSDAEPERRTGADLLANGITPRLPEEGSAIVVLRRVGTTGALS
jgi:alpha-galactosidase